MRKTKETERAAANSATTEIFNELNLQPWLRQVAKQAANAKFAPKSAFTPDDVVEAAKVLAWAIEHHPQELPAPQLPANQQLQDAKGEFEAITTSSRDFALNMLDMMVYLQESKSFIDLDPEIRMEMLWCTRAAVVLALDLEQL